MCSIFILEMYAYTYYLYTLLNDLDWPWTDIQDYKDYNYEFQLNG